MERKQEKKSKRSKVEEDFLGAANSWKQRFDKGKREARQRKGKEEENDKR
jgi:hypothetical protein